MNIRLGRNTLLVAIPATCLVALAIADANRGTSPFLTDNMLPTSPLTRGLIGPDIISGQVAESFGKFDMELYGSQNGIGGFAIATQACNIGDMEGEWIGSTNETPVISQNCYIYNDGVFRQIGISWLKHSFCALSEFESYCGSCTDNNDCDYLAIGCADTYWAGLNADATAPRTQINPSTGEYTYPFSISPSGSWSMSGKLQINLDDTTPALNPGARWVLESYYMSTDDAAWGNQMNNASWKEIAFTSSTDSSSVSNTNREQPAIYAWDDMEPGGIRLTTINTPEDAGAGRVFVGSKATDLGGGWWHYQYAIQNLNSHRSIDEFSLPIPDCIDIQNETFTDVFYHSGEPVDGTDWELLRANDTLTWSTDEYTSNPDANAIRWSSMYTFGFDALAEPEVDDATLGLWRPGPGDSVTSTVDLPWDDCDGECLGDANEDGFNNVNDLLIVISYWNQAGEHFADVNGDLYVDISDLLTVIANWGPCP